MAACSIHLKENCPMCPRPARTSERTRARGAVERVERVKERIKGRNMNAGKLSETVDVDIARDCVVRKTTQGHGKRFELRVGDPGWHKNATLLDRQQARRLRDELNEFLGAER